ncbi:MAG: hypothetical protein CME71_11140 [Halobacteriovorax sp.]|nr:hypothetical protein [Halobacteriovorax sp.]|tara:strand:+ start:1267 stop:1977 length:711 start_codon:yes stop_codon:yes gene_type:complete
MTIEHRNSGEDLELRVGNGEWFKLLDPPQLNQAESQALCQWLALQWSQFPQAGSATVCLPRVLSQPSGEAVCFYPGSFSPWHQGHQECVRQASEIMPVMIIPDANPWKNQEHREVNFNEVVKIAKALPEGCHLYTGFVHLNSGNPTSSWLPKTNWSKRYLCMGEDSFLGLANWKNIDVLLEALSGLFIIPRKVDTADFIKAETEIKKIKKDIAIKQMSRHQYEEVSSSEIRKQETP